MPRSGVRYPDIDIRRRIVSENLPTADLIVDAVYEGLRAGNAGDDPLSPLIGVSNQGGFRYLGPLARPKLVVVTSTFDDIDWPDHLDRQSGVLTYFGDNKRPGRELHDTPRNGNRLLKGWFDAIHAEPPRRADVPPILVFANAGRYRDMAFLGLAVPGSIHAKPAEDLVAVWKTANGQRFQNYRATMTILDVPKVARPWLQDIVANEAVTPHAPAAWTRWRINGSIDALSAEPVTEWRTKAEQLPSTATGRSIVRAIREYFGDDPVAFEACAAKLTQMMDSNFFTYELTRPSRDGGRDAIGKYRVAHGPSAVYTVFALEAKCYSESNSVGVKDLSRLISRLRHRQFGVLVTTSYLNQQAYRELKDDGHPIVVIAAQDIVELLTKIGLVSAHDVSDWLRTTFPKQTY